MTVCEKCWKDAGGDPDRYTVLVLSRDCTAEERAGEGAKRCPQCGRNTVHIHAGHCTACGFGRVASRDE